MTMVYLALAKANKGFICIIVSGMIRADNRKNKMTGIYETGS